jgi:glucose-1-phosphate thymidylyltransferase
MKAIIPVAGVGTRLRPHTYTQPKPLIPVAGKPIIAFIIDALIEAGVHDFVFVIGYLGEKIQHFVETAYPNIKKTFVEQTVRDGLGHAIWTARHELTRCKEILIVLGDTVFEMNLKAHLKNKQSWLGVKEVADPREFGVVELDEAQQVRRVVEKPKIPKSNLALVGLYKISEVKELIEILDDNIVHNRRSRGEFQLADALTQLVQQGVKIGAVQVATWFDCGKKEILLDTNKTLLEKQGLYNVDLPPFDNTIIVHPVSIHPNCQITDSIIGPYVTIGEGAVIRSSILKNSIIGSFAQLEGVMLERSIIGNDTAIRGARQSLNIGDNTEIDFS